MDKKKIIKKLLLAFILIFVIIATNIISVSYYKEYGQHHESVKRVNKVPDGFVSINYVDNMKNEIYNKDIYIGNLKYKFYPYLISFADLDNICIYETNTSNKDFIVKYKDDFYISERIYLDMIRIADIVAEQRNRIYNLGDMIILRSNQDMPCDYVIKLDTVETENNDNYAINTIKFTTSLSLSETQRIKIFDHIETNKGTVINEFTFIDDGIVRVKLPAGEKINMIVLKSPDYKDSIRKVIINE